MLLTLFHHLFTAGPTLPALRYRPVVVFIQDAATAVAITDSPLEIRTTP